MPIDGRQVNLFINLGSTGVPNWIVCGQATDLQESKSRSVTRVAHKDSNDTVPIAGSIERSFALTGFYFSSDAGQAAVDLAFENDIEKQFRIYEFGVGRKEFFGKVTNVQRSHPVGSPSTYNVTIEPTITPYPV